MISVLTHLKTKSKVRSSNLKTLKVTIALNKFKHYYLALSKLKRTNSPILSVARGVYVCLENKSQTFKITLHLVGAAVAQTAGTVWLVDW